MMQRVLSIGGEMFPVRPDDARSMINLVKAIKQGRRCMIYPEKRFHTGNLTKIYEGTAFLIEHAKAGAIIHHQCGCQMPTSLEDYRSKQSWFTRARLAVSPLEHWDTGTLKGKEKRQYLTQLIFMQLTTTYLQSYAKGHLWMLYG